MRWSVLLVAVGLSAACSDSRDRPDAGTQDAAAGGADAGSITGRAAELAAAVCARQAQCCPGNTETEEDCRTSIERVIGPIFTLPGIAVSDGQYATCKTRIESMSCDEAALYAGRPPIGLICEKFYSGTFELGATCVGATIVERFYEDDQCRSGACAGERCVDRAGVGASCAEAPCAPGLVCFLGSCAMPAALNEDCSRNGLCTEQNVCASATLTCVPPRIIQPGEVCEADTYCTLGREQCFCPVGQEGCSIGSCGNESRCLGR